MDRGGYSMSLIRQSLSLPYESHPHDIMSTMSQQYHAGWGSNSGFGVTMTLHMEAKLMKT